MDAEHDIAALAARIAAALARIGGAVDRLAAAPGEAAAALERERAANAQLAGRVEALKLRQDETLGALQRRITQLTQTVDAQALEIQRMRRVNGQLREALRAFREGAGSGDAALAAEFASLEAMRSAEVAEMDAILAALEPHVAAAEAAAKSAGGEDGDARA
jgi:chromosome segregation ATPase